jgi:two-component system nitrate/nitrite response regulator NarL
MNTQNSVPVWIICRNALIIEGLKRVLELNEFAIQYSSPDIETGLEEVGGKEIGDLVVIDCNPAEDCMADYEAIRSRLPGAKIALLSDRFRLDQVVDAFRSGIDGYMLKEIGCESLLESLRLIRLGEKVLPSELINHFASRVLSPCATGGAEAEVANLLSEREVETLRCLVQGFPNKVIAHRLDISEATVKVHVKAILRKLMVQNRTQAAIWAVNHGLEGTMGAEDEAYLTPALQSGAQGAELHHYTQEKAA